MTVSRSILSRECYNILEGKRYVVVRNWHEKPVLGRILPITRNTDPSNMSSPYMYFFGDKLKTTFSLFLEEYLNKYSLILSFRNRTLTHTTGLPIHTDAKHFFTVLKNTLEIPYILNCVLNSGTVLWFFYIYIINLPYCSFVILVT